MYGKTKLTKRQIKEDKFTIFMLSAKNQLLENWQYVVIGIAAVAVAIVAIVYYVNARQAKAQQAATRYARALMDYHSGNSQVAIMELTQVVEEYGDDDVAEQATFLLGNINYESRNYPEAIRFYEQYLAKYRENKLNRAAALAGIAACYENQGKFQEAAEKYVAAAEEYPDGPLVGDYYYSAMRNFLEVGDIDQAKKYLELVKEEYKDTDRANQAQRLFSEKSHT